MTKALREAHIKEKMERYPKVSLINLIFSQILK